MSKMKCYDLFYIQDAKADLDHSGPNVLLNGTEKYPVKLMGMIDSLDTDLDIFGPSSSLLSADEIKLELILSRLHSYGTPAGEKPYYMQFLFYDFDKSIRLLLFNAKITKINYIPKIGHALTIISTNRSGRAAYEIHETKHDTERKNGGGGLNFV